MTPFEEEVQRTARTRGQAAAVAMVEARAADDPEAMFILGEWRLWGTLGRPDLAGGHAVIAEAAALGHDRAAFAEIALIATGTGVARDLPAAIGKLEALAGRSGAAREQLTLFETMPRDRPSPTVLCEDPLVMRFDQAVPEAHRAYLIAQATPRLQPSRVLHPTTGAWMPNPVRDSDGTNFAPLDEDLALHAVAMRLATLSGTSVEQGEPLHALRYRPGQQYRPHLDALPRTGNQRGTTALLYLNGGYEGGETGFPLLDLVVPGSPGDVLVFRNVDADGRPDRRTLHAGLPVTAGEKWLATRWIREARFHPWEAETH